MNIFKNYDNTIHYLWGCVPLEYKDNYQRAINVLESIIEMEDYDTFKSYIDLYEKDIKYMELINRLYDRAIMIEREDLIRYFCAIKKSLIGDEMFNSRPIELAINEGKIRSLDMLLKMGYDRSFLKGTMGQDEYTPLEIACIKGNVRLVHYLLEYGVSANIASKKDNGDSPAFYVIRNRNATIMDLLVEYGVNMNYINLNGEKIEKSVSNGKVTYRIILGPKDAIIFGDICAHKRGELEFYRIASTINTDYVGVYGSILDIAIKWYGLQMIESLLQMGCRPCVNIERTICSISDRYRWEKINHDVFQKICRIIMPYLGEEHLKANFNNDNMFFSYAQIVIEKDVESEYIDMFKKLTLTYEKEYKFAMYNFALIRLCLRNKNIALIEYFCNEDYIPVQYDGFSNPIHDICIFNRSYTQEEMERVCSCMERMIKMGADIRMKNRNGISAIRMAEFIMDTMNKDMIMDTLRKYSPS